MTHRLCERRRPWKGTDSAVECFTDISPFCFDVVLFYMLIHYPKCNLLKENQAYSRHCHLVNQLVKNPEFNQRLSLQATSCRTNSGLDLTKRWKTNQRKQRKLHNLVGKQLCSACGKKQKQYLQVIDVCSVLRSEMQLFEFATAVECYGICYCIFSVI